MEQSLAGEELKQLEEADVDLGHEHCDQGGCDIYRIFDLDSDHEWQHEQEQVDNTAEQVVETGPLKLIINNILHELVLFNSILATIHEYEALDKLAYLVIIKLLLFKMIHVDLAEIFH